MSNKKQELIKQLLDKRAKESNTTDLNAYANGLEAMYDALNNIPSSADIIHSVTIRKDVGGNWWYSKMLGKQFKVKKTIIR